MHQPRPGERERKEKVMGWLGTPGALSGTTLTTNFSLYKQYRTSKNAAVLNINMDVVPIGHR